MSQSTRAASSSRRRPVLVLAPVLGEISQPVVSERESLASGRQDSMRETRRDEARRSNRQLVSRAQLIWPDNSDAAQLSANMIASLQATDLIDSILSLLAS